MLDFEQFRPLLISMMSRDPKERPTALEALQTLESLCARIPGRTRRWVVHYRQEPVMISVFRDVIAGFSEIGYQLRVLIRRAWFCLAIAVLLLSLLCSIAFVHS